MSTKHWLAVFAVALFLCACRDKDKGSPPPESETEGSPKQPDEAEQEYKVNGEEPEAKELLKRNPEEKIEWIVGPVQMDYNELVLQMVDLSSQKKLIPLSEIESIKLTPWMKIHGHGTGRVQPILTPTDDREYKVTNLFFTMHGPWELNLWVKLKDQTVFEKEIKVYVPE